MDVFRSELWEEEEEGEGKGEGEGEGEAIKAVEEGRGMLDMGWSTGGAIKGGNGVWMAAGRFAKMEARRLACDMFATGMDDGYAGRGTACGRDLVVLWRETKGAGCDGIGSCMAVGGDV